MLREITLKISIDQQQQQNLSTDSLTGSNYHLNIEYFLGISATFAFKPMLANSLKRFTDFALIVFIS